MNTFVDGTEKVNKNNLTLSTGVVLKCKPVASLLLNDITKRIKKPVPPRFMNNDLGREEENSSDPDYIKAMVEWEVSVSMAMIDTMIVVGTSVYDESQYMSSEWSEDLEVTGVQIPSSKKARYLAWIKYCVAPAQDDINNIVEVVGRLSGVSESDVNTAVEKFRSNAE